MPTAPKSTTRGDERRAEIMQAAIDLFVKRGYAGTSTDAIVERSGGSKATVYAHFGSKEGLFRAVVEAFATGTARSIENVPLDPADPGTALRTIGITFLTTLASRKSVDMLRLIIAESDRVPEAREAFLRSGPESSRQSVAAFLTRCDAAGSLSVPNAERYSEAFNALITEPLLTVVLRRTSLSARDIAGHVDRVLPLFLHMCQTPA